MTTSKQTARIIVLCAAASLCISTTASAAEGEGWDWMVAPYLWAIGVDMDLQTREPPSESSSDTNFSDIIDKLDGAFQVHVEGQGDRFGVLADFTYLGIGDDNDRPRFHTESDLDTRLFEIAAVWNPSPERFRGLDVLGGLRYVDIDLTAKLRPENPAFPEVTVDANKSFSDFMLGARYTWAMTDRWGLTLRGDGSWGDTEGTWNASAVAQYRTGNGAWLFGYRYLDVEVDTGNANTEIAMHGPEFGYGFRF